MGEFADMLVDDMYSYEEDHPGWGWNEPQFFNNSYTSTKKVLTCNKCGSDHVYWYQRENYTWTLYDKTTKQQHYCKIDRERFLEEKAEKLKAELVATKKELAKVKNESKESKRLQKL